MRGHSIREPFYWGRGSKTPKIEVEARPIAIDGDALTVMTRWDGDRASLEWVRHDVTSLPYHLRRGGDAVVLGVGGGRDVLTALWAGSKTVLGIELNGITVGLLTGQFRDYAGIANAPGGRATIRWSSLPTDVRNSACLNSSLSVILASCVLSAGLGIVGYLQLLGIEDLFYKYGRASGTIQDPNVFGSFLSTVPENIIARHCDMACVGLAVIVNRAAGMGFEKPSHEQTLIGARMAEADMAKILKSFIENYNDQSISKAA